VHATRGSILTSKRAKWHQNQRRVLEFGQGILRSIKQEIVWVAMDNRRDRIARAISSFVENPITNLVKGSVLVLIGLSEASKTLMDDITHKQLRVGHGLIIIGLFSILDSVPHLIEGLEASTRYLESRGKKSQHELDSNAGPDQNDHLAH
jgi:hypothetical protein